MKLRKIRPYNTNTVNAIIETPRGSQHKYIYDQSLNLFRLKKTLPLGMTFPFDFGFIPNTRGGDGDPLDVLVIMEQAAYAGCLVECRVIALLKASQREHNGGKLRNDRIVTVACASKIYAGVNKLEDLNEELATSIENFFVDYNKRDDKKFFPLTWESAEAAFNMVKKLEVK